MDGRAAGGTEESRFLSRGYCHCCPVGTSPKALAHLALGLACSYILPLLLSEASFLETDLHNLLFPIL